MHPQTSPRIHGFLLTLGAVVGALLALLALPGTLVGQMDIQTRAEEVITISRTII